MAEEVRDEGTEEPEEERYALRTHEQMVRVFMEEYDGTVTVEEPEPLAALRESVMGTFLAAISAGEDPIRAIVIDAAMLGYWYGITDATGGEVDGWEGTWETPARRGPYGQYPIDLIPFVAALIHTGAEEDFEDEEDAAEARDYDARAEAGLLTEDEKTVLPFDEAVITIDREWSDQTDARRDAEG